MWFNIKNQKITLSILAKPKAKKTALVKIDEQGLHISLHANPQEGEANTELIRFLAEFFKLPKSQIALVRGQNSRKKQVELPYSESIKRFLQDM